MFTGFSSGHDSAQPSSQQQQQLENNGTSQQQTSAAASSTSAPGAAAVTATVTATSAVGQGTPGQVYSTPTPPVGVAFGVASAGGLLPSPAYGRPC